jgi:uncharacterized protein with PIN domain
MIGIPALEAEDEIMISAGTMPPASARRIAEAYRRCGRGQHPAALNFGDCFAYEAAKEHAAVNPAALAWGNNV